MQGLKESSQYSTFLRDFQRWLDGFLTLSSKNSLLVAHLRDDEDIFISWLCSCLDPPLGLGSLRFLGSFYNCKF